MEIFKDIPGYEGKYQVTSWGRVYNVDTGSFVKPEVHAKGYLRVDLFDHAGKRKHMKVHRLVGMAFIPNPDMKPQINHKDGNKTNNSFTNLEWVTNRENKDHQMYMKRLSTNHADGQEAVSKRPEADRRRNQG